MEKPPEGALRRLRSEWSPTAWDLGVPVSLDTCLWSQTDPLRTWLLSIYSGDLSYLDHLSLGFSDANVLLYPGGFVRLARPSQHYVMLPASLKKYLWIVWQRGTQCRQHEAKLVSVQTMDKEWRRYGTPGSPPGLTDPAIGWIVTFEGNVFELHASDFLGVEAPNLRTLDEIPEPVIELPRTMMSFLFELHTKGARRFRKQAILGACLVLASIFLAAVIPVSEFSENSDTVDVRQLLWAIPCLVGLYQWFCGRSGIREAQLARAVSDGSYREPRLLLELDRRTLGETRSFTRVAPWFCWSIIKRVVGAILLLALGVLAVLVHVPFLAPCTISAALLVGVDIAAFRSMTDTHGGWFEIQRWL